MISLPSTPSRLLLLAAVGLATACPPAEPEGPNDSGQEAPFYEGFSFERSELIPTVVTASWTTPEPVICTLTYGTEGASQLTTVEAGEPSTQHEVTLVGLRPSSTGTLVVTTEATDGEQVSAEQTFTTGALPSNIPDIHLAMDDPQRSYQGFTLVPVINDAQWTSWVCILDPEGELVWALEGRHGANRARFASDGGGIMFIDEDWADGGTHVLGAVHSVGWDGTERWSYADGGIHHDFAILGDDEFVVLGRTTMLVDVGDPEPRDLMGDTLIALDSAGNTLQIWSVFDDLDPTVVSSTAPGPAPETGTWDWSHGNYLTWVPETGELLVSLREIDAIVAVDLALGRMSWSLSNDWGTYQPTGDEPLLAWPHSAELIDGGLSVFNQGYQWESDTCSWGAQLDLDAEQGTASTTWRHESEDCAKVFYLGSSQPLPNGDELVVFSQTGIMEEVTPAGEVVRRIQTSLGWTFGFAYQTAELRPLSG